MKFESEKIRKKAEKIVNYMFERKTTEKEKCIMYSFVCELAINCDCNTFEKYGRRYYEKYLIDENLEQINFEDLKINCMIDKENLNKSKEIGEMRKKQQEKEDHRKLILESIPKIYKNDKCVICISNYPNIISIKCGHRIFCEDCYVELMEEPDKFPDMCPICREYIDYSEIIIEQQ
jgi:hypothetical protein